MELFYGLNVAFRVCLLSCVFAVFNTKWYFYFTDMITMFYWIKNSRSVTPPKKKKKNIEQCTWPKWMPQSLTGVTNQHWFRYWHGALRQKSHYLSQCWSRTILQYGIVMLQCGKVTPYGDIELNIGSGNNVGVNSDSAIPIPIPAKLKFTIPIPIPWIAIAILFLSQYVNPWKLETHGCIFSCHCGYGFPGTKHQTCSSHSAH